MLPLKRKSRNFKVVHGKVILNLAILATLMQLFTFKSNAQFHFIKSIDPSIILNKEEADDVMLNTVVYGDSIFTLINSLKKLNDSMIESHLICRITQISSGINKEIHLNNDSCTSTNYLSMTTNGTTLFTLDEDHGICRCELADTVLRVLDASVKSFNYLLLNKNFLFAIKTRPTLEYDHHISDIRVHQYPLTYLQDKKEANFRTKGRIIGLMQTKLVATNSEHLFIAEPLSNRILKYTMEFKPDGEISLGEQKKYNKPLEHRSDSVYYAMQDYVDSLIEKRLPLNSKDARVEHVSNHFPAYGGSGIFFIQNNCIDQVNYSVIENIYANDEYLITSQSDTGVTYENQRRIVIISLDKLGWQRIMKHKNSVEKYVDYSDVFHPNLSVRNSLYILPHGQFIYPVYDYFQHLPKFPFTASSKSKFINLQFKKQNKLVKQCYYGLFSLP